jgi:hypothetical protein
MSSESIGLALIAKDEQDTLPHLTASVDVSKDCGYDLGLP